MQEAKSYSIPGSARGYGRGMDAVRKLVERLITDRGLNPAELSRRLGKNHAYVQQYLKRGVPRTLPEEVRSRLAELLGVDEQLLGAPLKSAPARTTEEASAQQLPALEHDVRASAGHGSMIEMENVVGEWRFPRRYVRDTLSIRSQRLHLISVIGDSMKPTLESDDRILIDLDDRDVSQPGVFALYDGSATVVKRVEKIPGTDPPEVMLISDNPKHNSYRVIADLVHVAGRVVWFGRKL